MFENKPSKNPLGFVVVKPTLIFSEIVERQLPMKSYFIMELERIFTPISVTEALYKYVLTLRLQFIYYKTRNVPSAQIGPLNAVQRQSHE